MTPYEATLAGLDAGAASLRIETDNGTLKVYHGDGGALLLDVSGVKAGTWDALWALLEGCGKVEHRARGWQRNTDHPEEFVAEQA